MSSLASDESITDWEDPTYDEESTQTNDTSDVTSEVSTSPSDYAMADSNPDMTDHTTSDTLVGDTESNHLPDDQESDTTIVDEVVLVDSVDAPLPVVVEVQQASPIRAVKYQKLDGSGEKRKRTSSEDEADGSTCTICLDAWNSSGDHRLVALKCGHLFGHTCVLRWLKSQSCQERSCPTCKARATLKDIRFIFARKLVAADNSEIDTLKKQLENAIAEKNRAELELQKSLLNQKMYLKQVSELRAMIKDLENSVSRNSQMIQSSRNNDEKKEWRFSLEKNLEICKDSGCRVLTYNCRKYELYVSQKSSNCIFPGYGIKKVGCVDYKLGQFILLHPKMIRDLAYSQPNDLLLSVSLDKTAKIFSEQSNHVTHTIPTDNQLWSCCWDTLMPNKFYVGGPRASTYEYDIRQPLSYVKVYPSARDTSPVISIASCPEGLFVCNLNSCRFYKRIGDDAPKIVPFDGVFTSMSYDVDARQLLLSMRPSNQAIHSRHLVCSVDESTDGITFNLIHSFFGSTVQTLLSRSLQFKLGSETWIAAHNETESAVNLFNINRLCRVQSLKSQDDVIDICDMSFNGATYLATLSQNRLKIYKSILSNL